MQAPQRLGAAGSGAPFSGFSRSSARSRTACAAGLRALAIVVLVASLGTAPGARAQGGEPVPVPAESPWIDAGVGMACVLSSLFYTPVKVLYAGFGTLTGVAGYALTGGRKEVLEAIINPALRGDYVITPAHLQRQRPLIFVGLDPEDVEVERNPVGSYPEDDRRYPERYPDPEPNPF